MNLSYSIIFPYGVQDYFYLFFVLDKNFFLGFWIFFPFFFFFSDFIQFYYFKVQPTSLSIDGTLGNFRLRDMAFEIDHSWGWLCDIRNPGVESLIKVLMNRSYIGHVVCFSSLLHCTRHFSPLFLFQFTFNSYSVEDDDYKGYDYSLCGRLSAVRIVFLYRFVQEVSLDIARHYLSWTVAIVFIACSFNLGNTS